MYTLLSIPALVLACFVWHWEFALIVIALAVTPLCALAWWWRPNASLCSLSHVVTSFGHGFWALGSIATLLGLLTFGAMQIIASIFVGSFLYWLHPMWQVALVIGAGLCAFIATEEACKAVYTRRAMARQVDSRGAAKPFIIASASASLGHAAALSIMLTYLVTESALSDERIDSAEFGLIAAYAFVFAAVSMPLNVLTSYLLALELNKLTPDELGVPGAGSAPVPPPLGARGELPPPSYQRTAAPDAWPPRGPLLPPAVAKVLRWPVAMRTLFTAQPFFWFTVCAPMGGSSAEVVAFALTLAGACAVYMAVLRRVKALEGPPPAPVVADPAAGGVAASPRPLRVRRRFGFALLADNDDDDYATRNSDSDTVTTGGRNAPAPVDARQDGTAGGLRAAEEGGALSRASLSSPAQSADSAPRPPPVAAMLARVSNEGLPPPPAYGDETGGGGVEMSRVRFGAAADTAPPLATATAAPVSPSAAQLSSGGVNAVPVAIAVAIPLEGAQSPIAVAQAVRALPPAPATAPSAAPGVDELPRYS